MKTLLLLLITTLSFGQSNEYLTDLDSARYYYEEADYLKSKNFWIKCVETEDYKRIDFYNLACCYANLEELDSAYFYLDKALALGFKGKDTTYLEKDKELIFLRKHPRWADLSEKFIKNCTYKPEINKALAAEIISRRDSDQRYRKGNWVPEQKDLDKANQVFLDSIISIYGWPTINLVGSEASNIAWLIVQHADSDVAFQKRCLKMMKKLFKTQEIRLSDYAYLYDRVALNSCESQLYGTQFSVLKNEKDEGVSIEFRRIKDSNFVDRRRHYMRLNTLEKYRAYAFKRYCVK